ncbi:P-type conjugative transfer protein TrbG [Caulobacter flavus]|uniref:P-type conjugative transfer protein TrbG n=1 Tax=Caulobacter flavus TaxID=1679497 RepID=A0A2N5CX61_9CAUL|nr:P-type conjugative transfer protein TrbG [Caulobacter flavus]AYV47543.1 P-type conjugative transfer protein TrbG [Caulobacter flavus]PLR18384.1 P-type conjugative transfer protein TrbG [Caulobacter flavus]
MTRAQALLATIALVPNLGLAAEAGGLQVPAGAKRFAYADEAVYPVIATPGRITDIVLEPGEALVGAGPIAAGDTVRWIIGDTVSGQGATRRVHVMIKPTAIGLATNLIINTDRRTYHLELRASARTWLSQVAWTYPSAALPAPSIEPVNAASPASLAKAAPRRINLGYRIEGDHPRWRPVRVFDDGQSVYLEFGPGLSLSDLPPLYRIGPDGKTAELINYRVEDERLVTERLFDLAELRLGAKRRARAVRLIRLPAPQYVTQEAAP